MLGGQMGFGLSEDDAGAHVGRGGAQRIVGLVIVLLGVAGLVWACWVLYQDGIYGWQTTDWNRLEYAALLPFVFFFVLFIPAMSSLARRTALRRMFDPFRLLRLLTAVRLAPPATLPPAPLSAEEQVGAVTFTALRPAADSWQDAESAWMPLSLAGFAIAMLLFIAPEALGHGLTTTTILGVPSYLLYVPIYVLALGGVFFNLFRMSRGRKGLTVTADATGLQWRRRGSGQREPSLAWSSISLFAKVPTISPSSGMPITVFAVETAESGTRLAWMLAWASKSREYAESDLLSRWIVTRSGQPLRDFTSIVAQVAQARNNPERLRTLGLPEEAIAALRDGQRYARRVFWTTVPVLLVLVLLFGGFFFAGMPLQAYQQDYFAGLVGNLHAETPLFRDPMSADDGQWVVEKPSAADNPKQESHAFVNGAYQMSGQSGQFVYALAGPDYGDAAVEVTARQVGAARDGTRQGVGLVLRSHSGPNVGPNVVVFSVSMVDGSWTLGHYLYNAQQPNNSWDYMDHGTSGAIQQGAGAMNRLLVLARGQTYLLYINDRFITAYTGRYHDTHDLPASGQAGVYLNDGAVTGSFTEFAVYPVQSPPSLSYV